MISNTNFTKLLWIISIVLMGSALIAQEPLEEGLENDPPLQLEDDTEEDPYYGFIALSGKNMGKHVRLRWAPNTSAGWYYAKDSGYYIQRTPIIGGMLDTSQTILLNDEPIKPWPVEKFESMYNDGLLDTMSLLVAQMAHGKNDLKDLSPLERSDYLSMRFSYSALCADLSPQAADAAGLGFTDTLPRKDSAYVYRVYSPMDTSLFVLDAGGHYQDTYRIDTIETPDIHKAISGNKSVRIEWLKHFHEHFFTAYYIERSLATEDKWVRLNEFPFLPILEQSSAYNMMVEVIAYKDSLSHNDVLYKYRLIGITPFGELSEPSQAVLGIGVDNHKPPPPTHVEVEEETAGKLTVKWKMPHEVYQDVEDPDDLVGFLVARSGQPDGPFSFLNEDIIDPGLRSFVDTDPLPFIHNYYLVYSLNDLGKYTISLPANGAVLDTIAPSVPLGLKGTIDSSGLVSLTWKLGQEVDLKGYFVYFGHHENGIYNRLTGYAIQDTAYEHQVSLNTLSREIYFKIAAIDLLGNVSERTEPLMLLKPDIYPPVSPQITGIRTVDQVIELEWASSSSMDVVYHLLERKADYDEDWIIVDTFRQWEDYNFFMDSDTRAGHWYDYKLTAVDASDLHSEPSDPRSLRAPWQQSALNVPSLSGIFDDKSKKVVLNWEYEDEDIQHFDLYRVNEKGILHVVKKIDADKRLYTDDIYGVSSLYSYRIRANVKGKYSDFSNEITIVTLRE